MAWSGARDGFDAYFTEKLWAMIPAVYRDVDAADLENPHVLRSLIEVIAEQAAHLRRSHDRLWDDQMIELAQDWAVPYIGALVGTRILPEQNHRGRIIDVAKTIFYRGRKGTPAILEQLASDIAGWEGVLSEGFKRLARTPHGLDAARDAAKWAGIADLSQPLLSERTNGPFDGMQHTADIAKPNGLRGHYGISRMTLHLYALRSVPLRAVRPRTTAAAPNAFTFDPSGRDVPLFARRDRVTAAGDPLDWDGWRPAEPWDVPASIPCRLLGHEVYEITVPIILALVDDGVLLAPVADQLRPLVGRQFQGTGRLRQALLSRPDHLTLIAQPLVDAIRHRARIDACGKARLLGRSLRVELDGAAAETDVRSSAASLADWADPRPTRGLVIDPVRGRFRFVDPPAAGLLTVDYQAGHGDAIGAGGFARATDLPVPDQQVADGQNITAARLPVDGALRVTDSATYGQPANRTQIVDLAVSAGPQERPYIRLTGNWRLTAAPAGNAHLAIDGLWIGADAPAALVLAGDWEEVRLSNVTLDPGGALTADPGSPQLDPVLLRVVGRVERLVLDRCITGRIETSGSGVIEALEISNSIVQGPATAILALDAVLTLERSTVIGDARSLALFASETLIDGRPRPRDNQSGCFRFSAAREGGAPPKPYRSHFYGAGPGFFRSRRFGDPDFARIRPTAPIGVRTGAEGGQEIGAFAGLHNTARLEGLRRKIEEYAPFGLLPIFHFET